METMELMCVRVLVFFLFFFFLWSSFSSSAGLDSHLNFRSLEEPAGEDGRGRGAAVRKERAGWRGRKEGLLLAPWVFALAVPPPHLSPCPCW